MKTLFRLLTAGAAALVLTGCGFHLRGNEALPPSVNYVAVTSAQAHAPLARALKKKLAVYDLHGGTLADSPSPDMSVLINIQPEQLERRLLSVFSTGQVAEYELIYGVRYTVTFPDKAPLPAYFEVLRDYQDDPEQVLAKSRELELVLSEMRDEAADKIIRRIASQSSQAVAE
ncbi:LPS assembly lipoprotein LptE [Alteromonas sp. 1_MG-2023]|uniref:LPS-assembly lipoprotein LptE n=1 Tax=Alteromonas sp. 1_MG-2023 TaxID=3062669 RepID=UPI0026E232A2|nr:LPS assembly lipoprotein LptE [Alteromonas sp. 1_MG-2023]MDO6476312.1 LPS assembly lipoprotein LptE [Alteromonas sp. 1_MG-2023]